MLTKIDISTKMMKFVSFNVLEVLRRNILCSLKKKKKEYKMPDSYALSVVRDVKARDQQDGYIRPPQYYDCYRKLLSDKFRKYKKADFEKDVKRLGPGHYTKLNEVTLG